jgi:hypothetical protein
MSAYKLIATIAGLAAAAILASGCGSAGPVVDDVVRPAVDDIVKIAKGPTLPSAKPFRPTGPPAAPQRLLHSPEVQPQPRATIPSSLSGAMDPDRAAVFVACEGASFYLYNGRMPTGDDWPDMLGGWVLSQIPAYKAQQVVEQLDAIDYSAQPFLAAAQLTQTLGCAYL